MRNLFTGLTVALVLSACNNPTIGKTKELSVASSPKPAIPAVDTISEIGQNRLIGDLSFGVPKKVARPLIKKFEKESKWGVGNFEFESVFDDYQHDSLYRLTLQGKAREIEEYNSILHDEIALLFQTVNAKYGNPSIDNGFPPINKIQVYSSHRCFGWNLGKKVIEIRIANMKIYYHALLVIYNRDIAEEIEAASANGKIKANEKAKEIL